MVYRNKGAIIDKFFPKGPRMNPNLFKLKTSQAIVQPNSTWSSGKHLTPKSMTRGGFTLPKDHTFYRLSTSPSTEMRDTNYCTASVADFNRYVASFKSEIDPFGKKTIYKSTFQAKETLKIPSTKEALDTLKEVIVDLPQMKGHEVTDDFVINHYNKMSGGSWDQPGAKKFIAKLKEKGFDGIVDEMDAGVIGDFPLVIFSPEKTTDKFPTILTEAMEEQALNNISDLMWRK